MAVTIFGMNQPTPAINSFLSGMDAIAGTRLKNAQTAMTNATIPWLPMKFQAALLSGGGRMLGAVNGMANSYKGFAQTPEGQKIIAANPQMANMVNTIMQQQSDMFNAGGYANTGMGRMDGMVSPGVASPALSAQGINAPAQPQADSSTAPGVAGNPQALPLTPAQIQALSDNKQQLGYQAGNAPTADIQTAAQDSYIKKNYPADIQKRQYAGERFNTSIQNAQDWFNRGASTYFGPIGQLKLARDAAEAAKGNPPQSYIAWQNFNAALENSKVQGALLEGVPADQISRSQFGNILSFHPIFNSAASVQAKLNNSIQMAKNAEAVNRASPSQLVNNPDSIVSSASMNNSPPSSGFMGYSQDEISAYAKKNNMSIDQVKALIKTKVGNG